MQLAIIIPAYNEARVIGAVLKSIPRKFRGISTITKIVVDDGSRDNTSTVAGKCGAIVARHPLNRGAGLATATGLKLAKAVGADIALTMDADGQHDPQDIPRLISPIMQKKADVVIGSRLLNARGMPPIRIAGNWLLNILTFLFYGLWSTDSQSGYKVFSKMALDKIELTSSGFEFSSEIIRQLKIHKLRFVEVPIKTIYTEYSKKKGQPISNGINILVRMIIKTLTG